MLNNNLIQIVQKLSNGILEYDNFDEYKKSLIQKINSREPDINPNLYENIIPETYIDNPLQIIPLDKIENIPPSAIVTKNGLEQFIKEGIEPPKGAFHGVRLDRQIDIPIAIKINKNGTFSIIDGMHRATQAVISNKEHIIAFIENGSGPTLEDVFNLVKNSELF